MISSAWADISVVAQSGKIIIYSPEAVIFLLSHNPRCRRGFCTTSDHEQHPTHKNGAWRSGLVPNNLPKPLISEKMHLWHGDCF
jgi:hypothetical protein